MIICMVLIVFIVSGAIAWLLVTLGRRQSARAILVDAPQATRRQCVDIASTFSPGSALKQGHQASKGGPDEIAGHSNFIPHHPHPTQTGILAKV